MAPLYGWGSTASRLVEPLREDSLLSTTKFPEKNLKKTLWPLFMDGVQLPQG